MTPINWNPWQNNPLDYIDAELATPDGEPVSLTREFLDFVVRVAGEEVSRTASNSATCAVLYGYQVGVTANV